MTPSAWRNRLGLVLLLGVVVSVVVWLSLPSLRHLAGHRRISRHIAGLRLGMSRQEVTRVMGQAPDCIIMVGAASVAYYAPTPEAQQQWPLCASPGSAPSRATWDTLPVIYAAAEVAFDASGRSVAYGFCGEGSGASSRGKATHCMRFLEPAARPD